MIFRGKGSNNTALRNEAKKYDQGVVVMWNEKAYANEDTTAWWLKQHYQYATIELLNRITPQSRLLSLDVFASQKTQRIKDLYKSMNVITSFILRGCTEFIQVLDVMINKSLKKRIAELADEHYDKYHKKYASEKYSVGERRVMLTEWVSKAWRELHRDKADLIRKTFRQVGLSLAVNESEDKKLWIKDISDVGN